MRTLANATGFRRRSAADTWPAIKDLRDLYAGQVYGIALRSSWALPFVEGGGAAEPLAAVEIVEVPETFFQQARAEAEGQFNPEAWGQMGRLRDGTTYLSWPDLFEFMVPADGRRIFGHFKTDAGLGVLQTYLLGQVLSYPLITQGIEPLHCTVVVGQEGAVGILGDCGYGKSSLAASFLKAGFTLLTDDLLVLREEGRVFWGYPGPPRIKLFPEAMRAILGAGITGTSMNPLTTKLVIPLGPDQVCSKAAPLKVLLVLRRPITKGRVKTVSLRKMNRRQAFIALMANTFNPKVTEPERLKRLFGLADKLVAAIPIKSLAYPQGLSRLPEVVETILAKISP